MRTISPSDAIAPASAKEQDKFVEKHGPLLGGAILWRSLGYRTGSAFRKAEGAGTVPVPTFAIAGRKGRFAWTKDVVSWLDALASTTAPAGEKGEAKNE